MMWKEQTTWVVFFFGFTLLILVPSSRYLMRFPTISAGWTTSSRMASCTAVSVRVRGRWTAEPFFGGLKILRVAMITTSCQIIIEDLITTQLKSLLRCDLFPLGWNTKCYLPAKFLLQLPNKPQMNLAESLPQSVGDINHHSLAISRNVHLAV